MWQIGWMTWHSVASLSVSIVASSLFACCRSQVVVIVIVCQLYLSCCKVLCIVDGALLHRHRHPPLRHHDALCRLVLQTLPQLPRHGPQDDDNVVCMDSTPRKQLRSKEQCVDGENKHAPHACLFIHRHARVSISNNTSTKKERIYRWLSLSYVGYRGPRFVAPRNSFDDVEFAASGAR